VTYKNTDTAAPATTRGRKFALKALAERRERNRKAKRIDNSASRVGAPMVYYCLSCGAVADMLPELHIGEPRSLCDECDAMKRMGWLV
jgi:hypothetical protein